MSFQLDSRHAFLLRRELRLLHLQAGEEAVWMGIARRRRGPGLLVCTTRRVIWIRSRPWRTVRRSWDLSLVERLEVHVLDVEGARIAMKSRTARRVHEFLAERRDAKAFAAAVASRGGGARTKVRKEANERLARLDRMVAKGTMTEAEARASAERILEDAER